MAESTIRRGAITDAESIGRLYALEAAMQEQFGGYALTPNFDWARWVAERLGAPGHDFFVADLDGAVVGYVHARGRVRAMAPPAPRPFALLRRWMRALRPGRAPLPSPAQTGDWGYIESLYVAEHARRRGLGRRLAQTAQDALVAGGAVRVGISVMHANGPALAFWNTLGFQPSRITLVCDADGGHD